MKNVNLIKTKTAIIILVILIILVMFAVFLNVEKFYQKEYESFPTLSIYYKDKIIGTLLPTSYTWTYDGGTQENNIKRLDNYDFPEENIILMETANIEDYYIKSNIRYKTKKWSEYIKYIPNGGSTGSDSDQDISRDLKKGKSIWSFSEVGEQIYSETIKYLKQGTVTYSAKIVTFEGEQARIAKNYLNTALTDNEKIDKLLNEIRYNDIYNFSKIDGKNLTIEYDYHVSEYALKMNNLILFTCIPELESVTYSPQNKKTIINDIEQKSEEVEKYVYTRTEVNNKGLANIENLKKFMEQI